MNLSATGLHGAHRRRDIVERHGRRRLTSALKVGELRPLWTGVVVESARELDPRTRAAAALLAAGPAAVLTGTTAAFLHGCTSIDPPATQVLLPYGQDFRSRPGLVVHHGALFAADVRRLDGLRVLALHRVVADLLCTVRARDAIALADEVLRRAGAGHEAVRGEIARRIRCRLDPRGTVRGAGLLDLATPGAESPPESWLRLLLIERGFPLPEANWSITTPDGREVYRIDLAWPGLRIAVEYDGYAAHAGREEADKARTADLRRRGWIVVHVTAADLVDPGRLDQELRSAFGSRGHVWCT